MISAYAGTSSRRRNGLGMLTVASTPVVAGGRRSKSRIGSQVKREYCGRCGQKKRACRCRVRA